MSQPTVVLVSSDSPKNPETIVTSRWLLWCHTQSRRGGDRGGIGRRLQGVKQAALPEKQLKLPRGQQGAAQERCPECKPYLSVHTMHSPRRVSSWPWEAQQCREHCRAPLLLAPAHPRSTSCSPAAAVLTSEVSTTSTETPSCTAPGILPADAFCLKSDGVTCFSILSLTPKTPCGWGTGMKWKPRNCIAIVCLAFLGWLVQRCCGVKNTLLFPQYTLL